MPLSRNFLGYARLGGEEIVTGRMKIEGTKVA